MGNFWNDIWPANTINVKTAGIIDDRIAEAEDAKVGIRNARKDANSDIKKEEKDGTSEDICKIAEDSIQKLTDAFIKKIDEVFTAKEAEIMKV